MSRSAIVRLDGQRVGTLTESDDLRTVTFAYDAAYQAMPGASPVSLTMPIGSTPIETDGLHPFFMNLLPEGWLLAVALDKLRIAPDDQFGLLVAMGADCAGAVEVVPAPAADES